MNNYNCMSSSSANSFIFYLLSSNFYLGFNEAIGGCPIALYSRAFQAKELS